VGVPQGSPISPLYSNIYLNLLDQVWHRRGYPEKLGATLHRYADDGILVCRKDATQALQAFEGIALRMGLTINREKTRITKLTEGFDFIGFEFVKRRSPSSGKPNIYIHPSKSSQRNIRRRIKSFTKRRRVEAIPECGSVRPRNDLHRERSHQVRVRVCACRVTKTVGPPDSGKLNVRWDGKGMVNRPRWG
jgi:Reverse transcriptase (RNA-dependent DNA polymerase)